MHRDITACVTLSHVSLTGGRGPPWLPSLCLLVKRMTFCTGSPLISPMQLCEQLQPPYSRPLPAEKITVSFEWLPIYYSTGRIKEMPNPNPATPSPSLSRFTLLIHNILILSWSLNSCLPGDSCTFMIDNYSLCQQVWLKVFLTPLPVHQRNTLPPTAAYWPLNPSDKLGALSWEQYFWAFSSNWEHDVDL